jgi:hypothetical protein
MGCTGFFAGTGALSARPTTTKTKKDKVRRAMTLQWSFAESTGKTKMPGAGDGPFARTMCSKMYQSHPSP